MTRRRRLLALLLVLVCVAAACGGTDKEEGGGGTETSATDTGKPVPGGKVVYALEAETAGGFCMPEAQLAISGIQVARAVYDTLTVPDADGSYKPFLAKSVTPNADYTEWTIVVRDGVTFHDGSALDATIVKNNIDAYRNTYVAADGSKPRLSLLFQFTLANIADTAVVDPTTVKVTMTKPWVAFDAYLFASGRLGIVAQSQLDAKDCDRKLVGTGPFKSDAAIANLQDITLTKNPNYWLKDADGVQLPYLDEIEFKAIPDDGQRLNAFQSGQVDMLHTDTGQTIAQLRELTKDGDYTVIETADNQAEVAYWLINSQKAPFDNLAARQAVALAFDADKYNNLQNAGVNKIANGPFAPDQDGYVDDTGFLKFNLDEAKKKVAEYKAATGQDLSFTLTTTNEPVTVAGAQIYKTMLEEAGIGVELAQTDQSTLINQAIGGQIQMFGWRNHPGGDPDTQYVWWYGSSILNFGKINDPELDKLLDDARGNPDAAARRKAYEDINKLFGEKVYNVWNYWTDWTVASTTKVQGLFGPDLPDGGKPVESLVVGHSVAGLWKTP